LDAVEARRVVEQAQHIRDLHSHHGWKSLVEYVSKNANDKRKAVLSGACSDIGDYRKQTGWLEGVEFVLDAAEKIEASARMARNVLSKGA